MLAELQVTPDVPIALIRLSVARNNLLVVSCNQLYTVNKWIVTSGEGSPRTHRVAVFVCTVCLMCLMWLEQFCNDCVWCCCAGTSKDRVTTVAIEPDKQIGVF